MSVASAASPSRSSFRNQSTRRFPSLATDKSRPKSHLVVNLTVFPPIVHPSQRFLLYHSKPILSRRSTWRRNGVLLSGEAVGGVQHREVPGELSFDAFLSVTEILCIVPPAIFSLGCLLSLVIPGASKLFQFSLGNKFCVWQFFFLVSAVAIGGLIRRRQWRRICGENEISAGVDLIARIEKAEQDMRSSATIVRVLSRHLEKLGIRFRVTRKALKEPIAETAALAKKNSEVTRALAMQGDFLEKELVEIQKVLLAMQEVYLEQPIGFFAHEEYVCLLPKEILIWFKVSYNMVWEVRCCYLGVWSSECSEGPFNVYQHSNGGAYSSCGLCGRYCYYRR